MFQVSFNIFLIVFFFFYLNTHVFRISSSVPLEPAIREKWRKQICKHQEFDNTLGVHPVCALHFDPSKIICRGKRTTLQKGTLPTIFPGLVNASCIFIFRVIHFFFMCNTFILIEFSTAMMAITLFISMTKKMKNAKH